MTVSCPDCRSVFRVDPSKVPVTGVRARCSVCGGIIAVAGGTGALRPPVRTPVPAGPMVSPTSATAVQTTVRATPAATAPNVTPAGLPRIPTPMSAPATFRAPTPAPTPAPLPRPLPPPPGTPARPLASAPLPSVAGTPVKPMPPAPSSSASFKTITPLAGSATSSSPPSPSATPRRTINPFLNADPSQRARRLARALVSDLVAYHPKKRDEGLAQGTLRQLFREDIKKSYEEYVEQVGRELAESSPHFQDALNDVLAGGQRLF